MPTRLKIEIALALRRTGYQADLEVSGATPSGDAWKPDAVAKALAGQAPKAVIPAVETAKPKPKQKRVPL